MEENSAAIEAILRGGGGEEEEEESSKINNKGTVNNDGGWKTVSYQKRHRKKSVKAPEAFPDPQKLGSSATGDVFRSIEQHSEERRHRLEAQRAAAGENAVKLSGDDMEDGADIEAASGVDNGGAEVKKTKVKKPKKPKVTVAEALAKIDASDLAAFLADITDDWMELVDRGCQACRPHLSWCFPIVLAVVRVDD
ncbi:unnamed protein product [Camellia sinensis]